MQPLDSNRKFRDQCRRLVDVSKRHTSKVAADQSMCLTIITMLLRCDLCLCYTRSGVAQAEICIKSWTI
jgi:hypothetical protein